MHTEYHEEGVDDIGTILSLLSVEQLKEIGSISRKSTTKVSSMNRQYLALYPYCD